MSRIDKNGKKMTKTELQPVYSNWKTKTFMVLY